MIAPWPSAVVRRTKPAKKLLGDKAYDSTELRQWLERSGNQGDHSEPIEPEAALQLQQEVAEHRQRHRIENAFCRLKDFQANCHAL